MITKDNLDLPITEITPENYLAPKGEEHLYHVKMEVKQFDQKTGERLSHPFIQKFNPIDLENGMMSLLKQQGYDMIVLHDPHTYFSQKNERDAKMKSEIRAAEKEALKKEILEKMAAEEAAKKKTEPKSNKKEQKEKSKDEIPGLN